MNLGSAVIVPPLCAFSRASFLIDWSYYMGLLAIKGSPTISADLRRVFKPERLEEI